MLDDGPTTTTSEPPGSPRPDAGPQPAAEHPALGPPPPGGRPGPRLLQRNRERAFDRAWRGGRLATFVGGTGRVLITVGLLILLFVGYQLWGTGLYTAQAQDDLKDDLKALIAEGPSTTEIDPSTVTTLGTQTSVTAAPTTTSVPPTTAVALPVAEAGEAVALIQIPKVDIDWAVVEGIGRDDLKKGPGHYPTTPWPGQRGNASIAGHRTTYGAPFNRLDELEVGDEITVTDVSGVFTYQVTRQFVVSPSDVTVLAPPDDPNAALLTLTTCHPKYSANERLIIQATLVGTPLPDTTGLPTTPIPPEEAEPANPSDNPVLGTPTTVAGAPATAAPTPTAPTPTTLSSADLAEQNAQLQAEVAHFHAPGGGFYLWALVVAAVGALWWYGFKRWTRWYTWVVGVVPFLFVLFFFYRQLEAVLPAGY